MITIDKIDTTSKPQVRRFVRLHFKIYRDDPSWVPPLNIDIEGQLDKAKYPFYEHSDADFFIATRDGEDVGRIACIENRPYNQHHGLKRGQFYHFETINDPEVANALFERLFEWCRERGLNEVIGPKGLSVLDGYGLLTEGWQYRQMASQMNHNPPYYPPMLEALGFTKEVDWLSCFADRESFIFPERIHRIAERVEKRGTLRVQHFHNKDDVKAWAQRIGIAYNKAFVNNWEYYPLSEREIDSIVTTLIQVADPELIKIIVHGDDVGGFVLAFPDVSRAFQRAKGRLLPFGLIDIMLEMRRTDWVACNSVGIMPEFHGHGGNALLYSALEKTVTARKTFQHAALYQVAETAVDMRRDLATVGGIAYKNHRVYVRKI